jgi:hypothetical protein
MQKKQITFFAAAALGCLMLAWAPIAAQGKVSKRSERR